MKNSVLTHPGIERADISQFEKVDRVDRFLKFFTTIQIIIHQKGRSLASSHLFSHERSYIEKINAEIFNKIFRQIKKSKQRIFKSEQFSFATTETIATLGYFIAKEYEFKNYDVLFLASWDSFLRPTNDDINLFNTMAPAFIIYFAFSYLSSENYEISELNSEAFKKIPFGLVLYNRYLGTIKNNFESSKKSLQEAKFPLFSHPLFPCYFDVNTDNQVVAQIFHFQRISLLGELINTLKHELSNPIFAMKLSSSLYENEATKVGTENAEVFREIGKSADRCLKTLENFSTIYLDTNTGSVLTVAELLDEVLVLTKSATRSIKKSVIIPGEIQNFNICANHWAISQVIFNLVINASQALSSISAIQPEIKIFVKKEKSNISFDIIDNGPGIDSEIAKRIFEPFFTTKEDGTGLGLAICKGLANKLNGSLSLVNPGHAGAHFALVIPVGG
ncbi:MAG: HAMP domain-containing histidine kinase [Bdellovibrio sp.]|nr:HAMP domain-containing histidine kinase [Bdellovibrio sp.]